MVIYQFKCHECEIFVEEQHRMKNAPSETTCPKCQQIIKRHYGSMNFILKGEGWPSKNIRQGKSPTETKKDKGLAAARKLEDVQNARKKAGMSPEGKNKDISEKEVKRRKENIHRWIDEGKK